VLLNVTTLMQKKAKRFDILDHQRVPLTKIANRLQSLPLSQLTQRFITVNTGILQIHTVISTGGNRKLGKNNKILTPQCDLHGMFSNPSFSIYYIKYRQSW